MEQLSICDLINMYQSKQDGLFEKKCKIPPINQIDKWLAKKVSGSQDDQEALKNIEREWNDTLLFFITNALRPVVYEFISLLNEDMKAYATAVISGGEAFNLIVNKEDRQLTSDIDTKVILNPGISNSSYAFLNFIHLFWYDYLEKRLDWINGNYTTIYDNYLTKIENLPPLKDLNVKFFTPDEAKQGYLPFRKRCTIMSKNIVAEKPVLFDIYLYAVDFYMKSCSKIELKREEKDGSVTYKYIPHVVHEEEPYLSGLIDLPIMREGFLGYDAIAGAVVKEITGSTGLQLKPSLISSDPTTYLYQFFGTLYTGLDKPGFDTKRKGPIWFGSKKTAMLYSIPTDKSGRLCKADLGSVFKFNVTQKRPLKVIDITNEDFIFEFTHRLLDLYDVDDVKKIQLSLNEGVNNCYKYLLRALTALGYLNVYIQNHFFNEFIMTDEQIKESYKTFYQENFESHCKHNVMIRGQRFSERGCDFELGQFIQYFWPNVDGYFGKRVKSCWHGANGFHAEVCLFDGEKKTKLINALSTLEIIKVSEYNKFKNCRFKINDDDIYGDENTKFANFQEPSEPFKKREQDGETGPNKKNRPGGSPDPSSSSTTSNDSEVEDCIDITDEDITIIKQQKQQNFISKDSEKNMSIVFQSRLKKDLCEAKREKDKLLSS